MDWSDSWRGAFRIEVRAEAIGAAWRGWPVLPGTYPTGARWAGTDSISDTGPAPIHVDWQERCNAEPAQVAAQWTGRPFSLLLATGVVADAIEVDDSIGRRAAAVLRRSGRPVPIAATPDGRWLFLTTSGSALGAELAEAGVVLHSTGSWIPLPPTPFQHGIVHWRVRPEVCGWQLPESSVIQDAITAALAQPVVAEPATAQWSADAVEAVVA